jgi:isocitrate dehydrogenase
MSNKTITVAKGDGIGSEIMDACLKIMEAVDTPLNYEHITVGKEVFLSGVKSGIPEDAWATMAKNKVMLKGPITTPQGGGYKSLNVTIRKTMALFANVRPVMSFHPYIKTNFPKMDVVVIRENEEDLYAGIEHQQTPEVVQCLKLVSRPGCEKIIRYAFEYAKAYGRKKVTCMTKDNIMKHTDGMFHEVFNEVREEYPEIESEHYIIDIGSARLANDPERFDVIVTLNLYGDIISDITAEIGGSVGMGGSANIGKDFAMFEAIHGSAPDIAGKNIANPSGLINAACMMLVHLGLPEHALKIQNALYRTIEDGIHTGDLKSELTKEVVGTDAFANAVIARIGQKPQHFHVPTPTHHQIQMVEPAHLHPTKKLVGSDIFIDWTSADRNPDDLGKQLEDLTNGALKLKMITNRGVKVYPNGRPETFKTDHWRCRFISADPDNSEVAYNDILKYLGKLEEAGLNFIKLENLYEFDGKRAYSLGQGE